MLFEDGMTQEEIDDHIMKGVEDAKNGRTLTMEEFKKYISDLQNTK